MKINLRNKSGQFCNFAEFAKEKPSACVEMKNSPQEAAEYIEEGRKILRNLRQLAEIIKAFGLPQNKFFSESGLRIRSDGSWVGYNSRVYLIVEDAECWMRHNERLAAVWTADSYETPDN